MPKTYIKDSVGAKLMRWRPIATAPRTGEARLLLCRQGVIVIGFFGWGGATAKGQDFWRDGQRGWRPVKPTHWMPLPARHPNI